MSELLADSMFQAQELDQLCDPQTPGELKKIRRNLEKLVTIKNELKTIAEQSPVP